MRNINTHYIYEPKLIGNNPLIIEVGLWSIENLNFINANHANCRLVGYEAEPGNFKTLQKNCVLPNMKVYHKALAWETGTDIMFKYEYPAWHSMYPKHDFDKRKVIEQIEVETISVVDMITEPVDLLLLNCEGCELAVFDVLTNNPNVRANVKQFCTSFHDYKCYESELKEMCLQNISKYYDVHLSNKMEVDYYLFIRK